MTDDRGKWLRYSGKGLPCDPGAYVDVCEGQHDVYIDVPARQSFDAAVTHWRPSIDDANRLPSSKGPMGRRAMAEQQLQVDFRECPHCGGYGVRDCGANCRTCGGVGRGGLRSPTGSCIGSGELMIERGTGRIISHEEFTSAMLKEKELR